MAMNYYDLISAVVEWSPEISEGDPIATFITLAEGDVFPLIKHYLQETTITLPIVNGAAVVPDEAQNVRSITIPGYKVKLVSIYSSEIYAGEIGYTWSNNSLVFVGLPSGPVSVTITYYARPTALSDANPTNWLLTKFANVYLHATLVRAYRWRQNTTAEAAEKGYLMEALGLLGEDHKRRVNSGNAIIDIGGGY